MIDRLTTLDGATVELSPEELASFRTSLKGAVLTPEDAGYDETRQIWNAMIDRRPGLIARCTGTADVVAGRALRARAPAADCRCAAAATTSPAWRCARAA